jgi:hypothetical protein
MRIKDRDYELLVCISLCFGYIFCAIYFASGLAFDASDYIDGKYVAMDDLLSRTRLAAFLYLPLAIMPLPSIYVYLAYSLGMTLLLWWLLQKWKGNIRSLTTQFLYLGLISPSVLSVLIVPSKESLVFLIMIWITKPSKRARWSRLLKGLPLLVVFIIRPPLVLLWPLYIYISSKSYRLSTDKATDESRRFKRLSKYTDIALTICSIVLLALLSVNWEYVSESIEQIIFQASYETGSSSTLAVEAKFESVMWQNRIGCLFASISLGFPYGCAQPSFKSVVGSVTYIFLLYICVFTVAERLGDWTRIPLARVMTYTIITLAGIAGIALSSVALLGNTATGLRYFSVCYTGLVIALLNRPSNQLR